MKKLLLPLTVILFGAFNLQAATVVWSGTTNGVTAGNTNVTGDSSVINSGTLVTAIGFSDSDTTVETVNGVSFQNSGTASSLTYSGTGWSLGQVAGRDDIFLPTNGQGYSTNLSNLLRDGANLYTGSAANTPVSFTLNLSGLTVGNVYAFQALVLDGRTGITTGGYGTTLTVSSGSSAPSFNLNSETGIANSLIGTFTADQGGQVFTFSADGPYALPTVNAFQLRDITAVPEPSTYMMLSLLTLFFVSHFVLKRRAS